MMCCVIGRSLPDATAPRRSSGSVSGSGLPSPRARRWRKAARSPRSCPGARARLDDHSVLRGGVVRNRLRVLRRLVSWSAAPRASASSNGEEAPETGPPLVSTDGAGTTLVPGWRNWSDAPDLKRHETLDRSRLRQQDAGITEAASTFLDTSRPRYLCIHLCNLRFRSRCTAPGVPPCVHGPRSRVVVPRRQALPD